MMNRFTPLAIFDLDNTLLNGDSDYAWGQFLVDKGVVDPEYYQKENDRFYLEYQRKTLDIHEYQRFVLTPLVAMSHAQRLALHDEFMTTAIKPLRLPKADELIAQHKTKGNSLLIITATNRLIAGPIGPFLGIDHILATEPEQVGGELTGAIAGTPCFQEGKIIRLQQWLAESGAQPEHTTFYSDSINDLPLLEFVDNPVVVDPDNRLREHAILAQWPILSLR